MPETSENTPVAESPAGSVRFLQEQFGRLYARFGSDFELDDMLEDWRTHGAPMWPSEEALLADALECHRTVRAKKLILHRPGQEPQEARLVLRML